MADSVEMNYDDMAKASQTFTQAAEQYRRIIGQIHQASDTLKMCLSGDGGSSAQQSIGHTVQQLERLTARAEDRVKEINDAIIKFRGDVDPKDAQRFKS